jgi:3-hydroxyacyl-CoA dehydrogenase / enoyl-CoA hydratase / 3-hydroxybutyryl-CoA epimerase
MSDIFQTEINNGVLMICFDRQDSDVNCISEVVINHLEKILDQVQADTAITGIVFYSGKKGQFIVGADIKEFERFQSAEDAEQGATALGSVFDRISLLPIPSVAAIEGQCLGGGLELSLACDWRVACDSQETQLGLPEIQLGLIPGAGGTQRLPRLIGIQGALDLILTGKRLRPAKARKVGLVDETVPAHLLLSVAREYAAKKKRKPQDKAPSKKGFASDLPRWVTDRNPVGRGFMRKKARDMIDEKTKGFYPASYKALDAVFDGYERKLSDGLKLERKLFGQLYITPESRSLIHLFHATTHCKKNPYKEEVKEKFGGRKTTQIGIMGAGLMGMGIATIAADRGLRVRTSDPSKESHSRGLKSARKFYNKKLKRKRLKPFEVEMRMARISPALNTLGFETCEVAIEAVLEDLKLKQKILSEHESKAKGEWIFATNTSALPVKEIAALSNHKDRVIGLHFFSPVEKMPLLEIVVTPETADWVVGRCFELGQQLGKQVVVVKDSPGFYTTRALAFYLNEAAIMLNEGVSIEDIDDALTGFGFPVGPITLIDEVGIDVGGHVLETMANSFGDRIKLPEGFGRLLEEGRLGRKAGKGFYTYQNDKKSSPDRDVYNLIRNADTKEKTLAAETIIDRCLMPFIAESVRCLEESVLNHAFDGDVGAVFGLGFPPFWGGPFRYCDHLGAKSIVERMSALESEYGERFKAPDLLQQNAESNKLFYPKET